MPNVGPLEIAVVLIIALVIFGPKRIPELGNSLGKGIREFKGSLSGEPKEDEIDADPHAGEARQLESRTIPRPKPVDAKVDAR